jgi:hypothetical protein
MILMILAQWKCKTKYVFLQIQVTLDVCHSCPAGGIDRQYQGMM